MKGFITKSLTAACLLSGLLAGAGCNGYDDLVDPCYPERYEYAARHEVKEWFTPQVQNGHFLEQTVWNYHFEPGTDHLTLGGQEHLAYLARRRPCPDTTLYVQTAQDIVYSGDAPEKFVEERNKLDAARVTAIQKYLNAETAGRNLAFNVLLHDPAQVGLQAVDFRGGAPTAAPGQVILMHSSAQGVLLVPPRTASQFSR